MDTFDREAANRWIDEYFAKTPESKLELIDGKLVISTLKGSHRIAWELLNDYGPTCVLPYATESQWLMALQLAFDPQPVPTNHQEWIAWATNFSYQSEPDGAGQHVTGIHRHFYELLHGAFRYFGDGSGSGQTLGRDFAVRLRNDVVTPDCIFIDQTRLYYLYNRYLDGVPAIAVEVTQEGSEEQDLIIKRQLYEQSGVPEYWLVEPELEQITFHIFNPHKFGYTELRIKKDQLLKSELTKFNPFIDDSGVYHSPFIKGLALSLHEFWEMKSTEWAQRWRPFLQVPYELSKPERRKLQISEGEFGYGSTPYLPRLALNSVPIRVDEFMSWCPEAKIEGSGKGMIIGGHKSTEMVLGMLAMTFGLVEFVKLAHPRDWLFNLCRNDLLPTIQTHVAELMQRAIYKHVEYVKEETYWGEVPNSKVPDVFANSIEATTKALQTATENRLLLQLARDQSLNEVWES